MGMLRQGIEDVQESFGALCLYAGIIVIFTSAKMAADSLWFTEQADASAAYGFVSLLITAAVYAAAQSVAFSRLGRTIDKPMWKISGDFEALRRFYLFWLALDLANLFVFRLLGSLASSGMSSSSMNTILFLYTAGAALILPFGASVMFHGRASAQELAQGVMTLMHQLPRTLLLVLFGFMFISMVFTLMYSLPPFGTPLLAVVDAYADFLLVAMTWRLCMFHRDEFEEPDDFDF